MNKAKCMDCELPYDSDRFDDLVVPHDVWNKIAPDDGLLCANCLSARCKGAQIECNAVFRSGPFLVVKGLGSAGEEGVEHIFNNGDKIYSRLI